MVSSQGPDASEQAPTVILPPCFKDPRAEIKYFSRSVHRIFYFLAVCLLLYWWRTHSPAWEAFSCSEITPGSSQLHISALSHLTWTTSAEERISHFCSQPVWLDWWSPKTLYRRNFTFELAANHPAVAPPLIGLSGTASWEEQRPLNLPLFSHLLQLYQRGHQGIPKMAEINLSSEFWDSLCRTAGHKGS